jgi:glutamate synthase domain-containing protein 3
VTSSIAPDTGAAPSSMAAAGGPPDLDADVLPVRELNRAIRGGLAEGQSPITVRNPGARHNLGVALLKPGTVVFDGSVGYYCAGMNDGARVEIRGSAGWGLAEGMLNGTIIVDGNAGNGAAASIRGGTVVVRGDCAARAGVAMKGGLLLIQGAAGYMTGFMMQKGAIVICGDAGDALADSMYEGTVFVGGEIAALGNDAVIEEPTADDTAMIAGACATYGVTPASRFRKIVAGRKLWNFEHSELETWRHAL